MNGKKYIPAPYKSGCNVIKRYEEKFTTKGGFSGACTMVDYIDKKKRLVIGFVMFVKWGG